MSRERMPRLRLSIRSLIDEPQIVYRYNIKTVWNVDDLKKIDSISPLWYYFTENRWVNFFSYNCIVTPMKAHIYVVECLIASILRILKLNTYLLIPKAGDCQDKFMLIIEDGNEKQATAYARKIWKEIL